MKALLLSGLALCLVACGGESGGGTGGGSGASTQPTITGQFAFDAGSVNSSSQAGGGFKGRDNLSIKISEGCSSFDARKSVQLFLGTRDQSPLAVGMLQVEARSSGTAGNVFANVSYEEQGPPFLALEAKSGTVTMTALDTAALGSNRGSFDVTLALKDGGTSQLAGTFDGSHLCR